MDPFDTFLYLSKGDIGKLNIAVPEVIKVVEDAFSEKAEGRTEAPPKPGIHPKKDAFIHAMPAYISKMKSAGLKWVSGFPQNPKHGLPYISGLLILNDSETGLPLSVMDCTWITAMRTGAATAISAKYLAREDSRILGILGCGVQGRSNLEALTVVFRNLEKIRAYDINPQNLQKYVEEMKAKYNVEIAAADSAKEAVVDCDIIVSAGPILKHPKPSIKASWFKNGGFACPLDFDSYWEPEAMHSMNKFCTDDVEQLRYYQQQGYFRDIPEVYAELSKIVSGEKLGRENSRERIMSMNLGLAIEDVATAALIYRKATQKGIGTKLPF